MQKGIESFPSSLLPGAVEDWRDTAMQPSRAQLAEIVHVPICPHYQLIEICASLVGISPERLADVRVFCGVTGKHEDSIGFLSGFRGTRYAPYASCSKIHDRLDQMLEEVDSSSATRLSNKDFRNAVIDSIDNLGKLKEIVDAQLQRQNIQERANESLRLWRQVIPDIAYIKLSDQIYQDQDGEKILTPTDLNRLNFPFTLIEQAADVDVGHVITYARLFLMALRNQVTGDNEFKNRFFNGARYCPLSPKRYESGMHS